MGKKQNRVDSRAHNTQKQKNSHGQVSFARPPVLRSERTYSISTRHSRKFALPEVRYGASRLRHAYVPRITPTADIRGAVGNIRRRQKQTKSPLSLLEHG